MPRSSRHKSHKASSKHREDHSESEDESRKMVKEKGFKDDSSVKASKELSVISEKRKGESKDLSSYRIGDVLDVFVGSKRRKDRGEISSGVDRWNGGGDERGDVVAVEKEEGKGELKAKIESKSKSSRRHDFNEKEDHLVLVKEKDEIKSERNEAKLKIVNDKLEKERIGRDSSSRKESSQYKDSKEERVLERDRKIQDSKRGVEPRKSDGEAKRKHVSQLVDDVIEHKVERTSNTVRPMKDELQNQDLGKEVEKNIWRKGEDGVSEKEKYMDEKRESDDRHLQSRVERGKEGRYKDERYKEERNTDRSYREERNTERSYKEEKNTDRSYKEDRSTDRSYKDRNTDRCYKDDRNDRSYEERSIGQSYKEDRNTDRCYKDDRNDRSYEERSIGQSYKEDRNIDRSYKEEKSIDRSYNDERNKDGSYRDKYRDDVDSGSRYREGKQKVDTDKGKKQQVDKHRDEHSSRDRPVDKSDHKRLRDGIDIESRSKKTRTDFNDRDASPTYDDRGPRYKDDRGNRRYDDKEFTTDIRSRGFKEHRSDLEKRSASNGKAGPISDRERPRPRYVDTEPSVYPSRRRGSPISTSVVDKDQYRYSKNSESNDNDGVQQEEQMYESRDGTVGGSDVPLKVSAVRLSDNSSLKDDDHMGRLSAERRIVDTRNSPIQLNEKSPSSYANRGSVRRSIDVEDSGQRSGGSKDLKDYSGNDGKRYKDLPTDSKSVNAQIDGENMSVSSPFVRTNYSQPGYSKSHLPSPSPFRTGVDNSSAFGSFEDDGRGMRNNRFKRIGDSNMNRVQPNAWKGVPSWPSPMSNGFIHPFPHGPPPVGFHPAMQQFSTPAMYGVRPSMDVNHQAVPYHIPDAERYGNHVRPYEGWGTSNGMGDASRMYGMVDWDHNRNMFNGAWDTSVDMWNRQDIGAANKLASIPQVGNTSNTVEDPLYDPFNQAAERGKLDIQGTENGTNNPGDILAKKSFQTPIVISGKVPKVLKISRDENAYSAQIYLSKLNLSDGLLSPEFYNECQVLMCGKQDSIVDVDMEGVTKARVKMFNHTSNGSLFAAIDDSILKRAMSLYKKQKGEMTATTLTIASGDKVLSAIETTSEKEVVSEAIMPIHTDNQVMTIAPSATPDAESSFPTINPNSEEKNENEGNGTTLVTPKLEESLTDKEEDTLALVIMSEKTEDGLGAAVKEVKMDVDTVLEEETSAIDIGPSNVQQLTENKGEINMVVNEGDSVIVIKEEKLEETMCDPACEAVMMAEFNDLESSVNLSRIHHMPESTH